MPTLYKLLTGAVLAVTLIGISGSVYAKQSSWKHDGNVVITHQQASESGIDNETAASGDWVITHQGGAGAWLAHIEINSTPRTAGVSAILPEANGDIGSSLDEDGDGRIQLSEFYYTHDPGLDQVFSVGYIDVSGFFEQSRIASDETTQFLGASFTGNPTIEFPDYTLGIVYKKELSGTVAVHAALAGSNGLADNPERSYSELVSVGDDEKGVFAITSASWKTRAWLLRSGAWVNSADHQTLDAMSNDKKNYGAYLLAGYKDGPGAANIRLGLSNENVSRASAFASLGYQFTRGKSVLGAGVARIFLSSKEPDGALDDTAHYEIYLRYKLKQGIYITGDIQRIVNSGFGNLPANRDRGVTVSGVRLTWLYE